MSTLQDLIHQFDGQHVVVIGDVMIDRYLRGSVSRISPEAPVPVLHYQNTDNRLGGAANVALNLRALGATVHLLSTIGTDENGDLLCDLLPRQKLSARCLHRSEARQTTVKTRVLAGDQQLLRVDREDTHDLTAAEEAELLQRLRDTLAIYPVAAILLQDYNKGVLTERLIREVLLESVRRDIPVAVDPKKRHFWAYQRATLFKPNLKEVREGLDRPVQTDELSLREAAQTLRKRLRAERILITLGEAGVYADSQAMGKRYPTRARAIADVCGAGDSVISIATLCLTVGATDEQIAQLANLAGGQVCESVGVVPVDKARLLEELDRLEAV